VQKKDLLSGLAAITAEHGLMTLCARTHLEPATREAIQATLQGAVDWPRFVDLARAHQVLSLVGTTLCESFASGCPAGVLRELRAELRASATRGLVAAQRLVDIVERFAAEGIPVLPYKGPLLSTIAYGHPGLREFGDLDVWVHPWDDYFRVAPMLVAEGWTQVTDFGFERSYEDRDGDTVLDVHRAPAPPHRLPLSLRFDVALERSVTVRLAERDVRTLCPEDLLIVLCVQVAKDAGDERRGVPLIKVCDIAELARSHPDLDWAALVREARRLGVLRIVAVGLAVARELLHAPVPAIVMHAAANDTDLSSLVHHVLQRIFLENGSAVDRPDLLDAMRWNAALRERYRDRSPALIALTEFALAPNDFDYAFMRLPRRLHALYRLVRPVRVACKYASPLRKSSGTSRRAD
jgi:hypothetical protein